MLIFIASAAESERIDFSVIRLRYGMKFYRPSLYHGIAYNRRYIAA